MVELLTESLRRQPRQPFRPPSPPSILVEPSNNGDIITLTQKFNKMKPLIFRGSLEPLKAEAWVLEIEKLFECVKDRKVAEFEQLKQGTMSVTEYEAKFTELARYAPHMVDTNYKKAKKFEGGLDVEVLDRINVLKLVKYVDVLDRAIMAEANIVGLKQAKTPVNEWNGKKQGFNFKKGQNNSNNSQNKRQNTGSSNSSSQENDTSICPKCRKRHRGVCHRISSACFRCGK
ncbi:uncharacterized protein LOC114279119 [Camellia sinensis]|uniref:uncharacterized protein LOC114279119 n=1 Tax=Camellia sinensis TaxID=4442 RepID=UPI001035729E|nr:uncharacterized protein LOC114279119 [Camellia sinensis]